MAIATRWKSAEEIQFSLRDAARVGIISCDICANFCDTGGIKGMRYMKGLLEKWGKTVVMQKCVLGCCSEEIMKQALRIYRKSLLSCDTLVILSCSSGIQNIMLCEPGITVIVALDTVGSEVITRRRDHPTAESICSFCGRCVLAYTGGICPIDQCPEGRLYGPCDEHPEAGGWCVVDPRRKCVWNEIEARWDTADLQEIRRLREEGEGGELCGPAAEIAPPVLRKMLGWIAVRLSQADLGTFFGWIK